MRRTPLHGEPRDASADSRPAAGFPDALVAQIAAQARIPEDIVASMLREELAILAEDARITQFMEVLAAKRVKTRLRKRHRPH